MSPTMRRSNMLSHYKLVSLYVANNGRSQNFSNIHRLVKDTYPHMSHQTMMCHVYALFHAGRMCHQQGWIRGIAKVYRNPGAYGMTSAQCQEDCRRLVNTFKHETIACWEAAARDYKSYFNAMCEAYDKEKDKKNKQAKKDRLRAKEVKLARKLLRQGMH